MSNKSRGFIFRGQVQEISDLMDEIEYFLNEKKMLTNRAVECINKIRDESDDLFYIIPLK
jgi:hypothetical protein